MLSAVEMCIRDRDVDDFEMDPISISGVPMSFDINTDEMCIRDRIHRVHLF